MEFYTSFCEKRPIRLSERTRLFAYESLNHKYGLDTKKTPYIEINATPEMTLFDRYDAGITAIAKYAPIRICGGERISGAATLGDAIDHYVPFHIEGEEPIYSVSHLTVDFETVLKCGINGIRKNVNDSLLKHKEKDRIRFLKSCIACLDAFDIWHKRYLDALKDMPEYSRNYQNLLHVPHEPAKTFYEAVQSIWFTFAFIRLCGNWPGIGRIDYLLGPYLKNDLKNGIITIEEAREILSHFFIKGCEWIKGGDCCSGDAQHYQNILIAGIDENGNEITNEVTYLVLDIIEEFGISDFPTSVRLNSKSDAELKKRVAEAIRYGGGILAVYNEDLVIKSLTGFGYSLTEARKFANDGCWEVQIPGRTRFGYIPFDSLRILQNITLKEYSNDISFSSFEDLLAEYDNCLRDQVRQIVDYVMNFRMEITDEKKGWEWKTVYPCTVVSLFEGGCIDKARSYYEGGPIYTAISPHIGGLPDTVNSLYAIKKIVFDEKKISFKDLMELLRNNWEGNEPLRQYMLSHYRYFGNNNDEADEIARHITARFADFCAEESKGLPIRFPAGVSTFGRQLEWSNTRMATPFGTKVKAVLAGNLSPTPGTDIEGVTSVIASYCKCDLLRMTTGAALDVKLLSKNIEGEAGVSGIVSLLEGFVNLGGFFMQIDTANADVLRDAQEHPENYQTLSVRVSGWNARFVTLNREWQDMIIGRAEGTI